MNKNLITKYKFKKLKEEEAFPKYRTRTFKNDIKTNPINKKI
jgi:hypothetical protein